jgi:hypothetical protein
MTRDEEDQKILDAIEAAGSRLERVRDYATIRERESGQRFSIADYRHLADFARYHPPTATPNVWELELAYLATIIPAPDDEPTQTPS